MLIALGSGAGVLWIGRGAQLLQGVVVGLDVFVDPSVSAIGSWGEILPRIPFKKWPAAADPASLPLRGDTL